MRRFRTSPTSATARRGRTSRLRTMTAWATVVATTTVAAPLVQTAPASAGPTESWYIDANTLTVVDADEEGWLSNGDEPKIAVVAFRTKLGVNGSTQAWKVSNWDVLCTNADDGDRCNIPNSTGRAHFGNVRTPTLQQIASGAVAPELFGTIQVTMEDDATPNGRMNEILDTLVNATRSEIAAASESLDPTDLDNLSEIGARFGSIGDRIQDRVELSFWQKIGTWFASFTDPDDKVDYFVTAMVGVDSSLRDPVNLALLGEFYHPGSQVAAAVVEPRNLTLPHTASGIRYDVAERIYRA